MRFAIWSFGLGLHFRSSSSKKSPLLAYFCDTEKWNFDVRESLIFPLMNRVRDPHTSIRTSIERPTTCSIYTQCNLCMQTVQSEIILNNFILSNKIKLLSKPGGTRGFCRLQLITKEHLDGYLNTNSLQPDSLPPKKIEVQLTSVGKRVGRQRHRDSLSSGGTMHLVDRAVST